MCDFSVFFKPSNSVVVTPSSISIGQAHQQTESGIFLMAARVVSAAMTAFYFLTLMATGAPEMMIGAVICGLTTAALFWMDSDDEYSQYAPRTSYATAARTHAHVHVNANAFDSFSSAAPIHHTSVTHVHPSSSSYYGASSYGSSNALPAAAAAVATDPFARGTLHERSLPTATSSHQAPHFGSALQDTSFALPAATGTSFSASSFGVGDLAARGTLRERTTAQVSHQPPLLDLGLHSPSPFTLPAATSTSFAASSQGYLRGDLAARDTLHERASTVMPVAPLSPPPLMMPRITTNIPVQPVPAATVDVAARGPLRSR